MADISSEVPKSNTLEKNAHQNVKIDGSTIARMKISTIQ